MEDLIEAFLLESHRHVQIVGGGGKTTLMLALAGALRAAGRPVLVGTSAHIRPPADCPALLLASDGVALADAAAGALDRSGWACVAGAREPGTGKLSGLPGPALDALHAALPHAWLIVEADGARGRPLKAHAPHEPALSAGVGLVVAVAGISALGRPLCERTVHRAERLARRLGLARGARLEPAHLAAAVAASLARCPPGATRIAFLSQVLPARAAAAAWIGRDLLATPGGPRRVVWGDLGPGSPPLRWADAAPTRPAP